MVSILLKKSWWRSFFQDLEFQRTVDMSSEIAMECLWYCFQGVLQAEFHAVRERWNTHRIRKSRSATVAGRLDSLYLLPEIHGACNNGVPVSNTEVTYVTEHIIEHDSSENHDFQDHFDCARTSFSISLPKSWKKVLLFLVQKTNAHSCSW